MYQIIKLHLFRPIKEHQLHAAWILATRLLQLCLQHGNIECWLFKSMTTRKKCLQFRHQLPYSTLNERLPTRHVKEAQSLQVDNQLHLHWSQHDRTLKMLRDELTRQAIQFVELFHHTSSAFTSDSNDVCWSFRSPNETAPLSCWWVCVFSA